MDTPNAELTRSPSTADETSSPITEPIERDDDTGALSFQTVVDTDGEFVVVHAGGDLDLDSAPLLAAAIVDAVGTARADGRPVRLDLREVAFIDSTGLRALLAGQTTAADAGVDLGVDGLSAAARRLLELTDTLERLRRGDR